MIAAALVRQVTGSKKPSRTRARHKRGQHVAIHGDGVIASAGSMRAAAPGALSRRTGSASHQDAQCAAWRSVRPQRKPRPPKRAASCAVSSAPSGSGWSAWPRSLARRAAIAASCSAALSAVSAGGRNAEEVIRAGQRSSAAEAMPLEGPRLWGWPAADDRGPPVSARAGVGQTRQTRAACPRH